MSKSKKVKQKKQKNSKITSVIKRYLNEQGAIMSTKKNRATTWTKRSKSFKQEQQSMEQEKQ
jgi:hypothetical protein